MTKTVWITYSIDEATIMAASATADLAKAVAQNDLGEGYPPIVWRNRRDGRFVSVAWEYAVLPFEVIE